MRCYYVFSFTKYCYVGFKLKNKNKRGVIMFYVRYRSLENTCNYWRDDNSFKTLKEAQEYVNQLNEAGYETQIKETD